MLLHHKVILLYESEFFLGGGDLGLFWASCSEDQNMGSNEVIMDIISKEMDYVTP